jgi:hypothetical protein
MAPRKRFPREKAPPVTGLDNFERALLGAMKRNMDPWMKSKKKFKLILDEMHKEMFELGPPTPPNRPTGRQRYLQMVSHYFTEITTSFETMNDIEFYLGRFPYRKTAIARHRHLQFHVEAYLHELYLLEQRLLQFLTYIERKHKRDPRLPAIKDLCGVMKEYVLGAMKKGTRLRSSHVHQSRLSDTQIERLHAIRFYTLGKESELTMVFRAFYLAEYRKIRRRWRMWVAEANSSARKMLDTYFDGIFPAVFEKDGAMRYPSRLKF